MKIKSILLKNFGKHTEFSTDFGNRTAISGCNGIGKTTIKTAIQYVMNVRNENGKEISGIRPHDENGVDIDGLVTSVTMTVENDGAENEIQKELYQKKNRQGDYTGEDGTNYIIDGVKKGTKKAYDEFVSTLIPNEVCINANVLLQKDTAGRRELLKAFEKHTDDDVIAENPQFEPIKGKLRANSIADLKKSLREKIKGSKSVKGLEHELDRIEVEIELQEKSKVDIDVAELELHRNGLKEQIAEVKAKIDDTSKQTEEYQKLSDGILELKFAEGDLQRKANEENIKNRREIENKISEKQFLVRQTEKTIADTENCIGLSKKTLDGISKHLQETRDKWKFENECVFDENSLICSYCGQEYPVEKKEQLRAEFESHKAMELKVITDRGNNAKTTLDTEKETLRTLELELEEHKKSLEMLETAIADLTEQLTELPTSIDITDTEEYKAIQSQIAEKEKALAQMNSASDVKKSLNAESEDLQTKLAEIQKQLDLAQKNVEIDERISELQGKKREVAQKIADVEKELYLLKEFERKKAELLEADVNEYFEFAKVKMFETQVNGELRDVCEFYVNGTAYSRNLNCSDKILTEADICRAFQKLYGVNVPIILDNVESIDNDRIPNVDNQLILIKRTDDRELKVEVV